MILAENGVVIFCLFWRIWTAVSDRAGSSLSIEATYMSREISIGKWSSMGEDGSTGGLYGIGDMDSSKIVLVIVVLLGYQKRSRFRSSEEAKFESKISTSG